MNLEEALASLDGYEACKRIGLYHDETTQMSMDITMMPQQMSYDVMSKDLVVSLFDCLVDTRPKLAARLAIKIRTFLYTVVRGGSIDHGDIYRRAREATLQLVGYLEREDSRGNS